MSRMATGEDCNNTALIRHKEPIDIYMYCIVSEEDRNNPALVRYEDYATIYLSKPDDGNLCSVNIEFKNHCYIAKFSVAANRAGLIKQEISMKIINKILSFCLNVKMVTVFICLVFSIDMGRDNMRCVVSVVQDEIRLTWHNVIHTFNNCSHDDGFDKFLELFSQTPFCKLSENIK
jgi:hypothetical protein